MAIIGNAKTYPITVLHFRIDLNLIQSRYLTFF